MEWRIRKSGNDFVAERGMAHGGGVLGPRGIGYTMPAFIVYESTRFDTEAQARQYIKRNA